MTDCWWVIYRTSPTICSHCSFCAALYLLNAEFEEIISLFVFSEVASQLGRTIQRNNSTPPPLTHEPWIHGKCVSSPVSPSVVNVYMTKHWFAVFEAVTIWANLAKRIRCKHRSEIWSQPSRKQICDLITSGFMKEWDAHTSTALSKGQTATCLAGT